MLSCHCDIDDGEWYYHGPYDFTRFDRWRRKRCCSCHKLIDHDAVCAEFLRFRSPYTDIEERIWGDEVQLASWFMCEWCAEMYFNFDELGFCINLGDSMRECLDEYLELYRA